jgi:uncharacterized protein (TIGR02757 family)
MPRYKSRAAPRISKARLTALRSCFEALHERYNRQEYLYSDPLSVPAQWPVGVEREIAALLVSWLASGRASAIVDASRRLLDLLSSDGRYSLRERIEGSAFTELIEALEGFRYRWVDTFAMGSALHALGIEMRRAGGPLLAVAELDDASSPNLVYAVEGFAGRLEERARAALLQSEGSAGSTRALKWLLANPSRGGTAKRWMMWLRWFVRSDAIDFGGHEHLGAHRLIVPLDTHVFRISRYLGFTRRRTPSFAAALEITAALELVSPGDPLRYDFSLSRMGILGHCPPQVAKQTCAPCALLSVCRAAVR